MAGRRRQLPRPVRAIALLPANCCDDPLILLSTLIHCARAETPWKLTRVIPDWVLECYSKLLIRWVLGVEAWHGTGAGATRIATTSTSPAGRGRWRRLRRSLSRHGEYREFLRQFAALAFRARSFFGAEYQGFEAMVALFACVLKNGHGSLPASALRISPHLILKSLQ